MDNRYVTIALGIVAAIVILIVTVLGISYQVRISKLPVQVAGLRQDLSAANRKIELLSLVNKEVGVSAIANPNAGQRLYLTVKSVGYDKNGNLNTLSGDLYVDPYPGCSYGGRAYITRGMLVVSWQCRGGITGNQEFSNLRIPILDVPVTIESIVTR